MSRSCDQIQTFSERLTKRLDVYYYVMTFTKPSWVVFRDLISEQPHTCTLLVSQEKTPGPKP